jgi:hypothetical protein
MNLLTRPAYRRSLKKYSRAQLAEINVSIARLPHALGSPHVHSGLSIRKLRPAIFELRAGLQVRILFAREGGDLVLMFAGNHDEVRAWLKENI